MLMSTRLPRLIASALCRPPLVRGLTGHSATRAGRLALSAHAAAPCRWLSTSGVEAESAGESARAQSATEAEPSEKNVTAASAASGGADDEADAGLPPGLTDERLAEFLLNEWEAPKRSMTVRCECHCSPSPSPNASS